MAADTRTSGSFDDLPDAELRIVLAVPLALPTQDPAPPPDQPEAASPVAVPSATGRHRAPVTRPPRSPAMETLRVGLSAAAFVVVLVVLGLLAVDRLAR
ncbi:MAG TPA: hypothetical protein VMW94_10950 [Actinomycetes bacterium]|nr:hypothetical protein [Actinomycetes bacterium]